MGAKKLTYDPDTHHVERFARFQADFIAGDSDVCAIIGAKGSSKAQPLSEPVLTPTGWVEMGVLQVGDYVIGSDGQSTKVTGVFPQGVKDVYLITMSDDTSTRATADHLWAVQTGSMKHRTGKFNVLTTKQILSDLKTSQGYNKWYMPLVNPVNFHCDKSSLQIPPYTLGVILGDGGLTNNSVIISTKDTEIIGRLEKETGLKANYRSQYDYALVSYERTKQGYSYNPLVSKLRTFGLMGKKSEHKFIPYAYLHADVTTRIELMRGLMDTDGHVNGDRATGTFSTTSPQLAEDFVYLCRSLGLVTRAKRYKQRDERYLDYYTINVNAPFNPFWIDRKASKFNVDATQGRAKSIESIELVGQEECQCISVEAEDRLYVTNDFIVTHNTFSGARFIINEMDRQPRSRGLLMWNTLKQAEDIFVQDIEPLLKSMALPYSYNKTKHDLSVNGCLIHLRSAEPNSIENIESVTYDWGWADECSFYSAEALTTFDSRIRTGLARRRYTSMPDEPDAFMYSFLEGLGAKLYEIGLRDNPSRKFRERYETQLRAIYAGAELDRYLYGKRVSLTGAGAFAVDNAHRTACAYDPSKELILSWDFNVEYRAVSAWQHTGSTDDAKPIYGCVRSWQMKLATVYEDAEALCRELSGHTGNVVLIGDASGANRTALTTASMWTAVREVFYAKFGAQLRYLVPDSNPPVKDTIQCLNWALRNNLVQFDPSERNVFLSLAAAKLDKYGDIDKSGDHKASGAKSHETDTARYFGWYIYGRMFPGNLNTYWVV